MIYATWSYMENLLSLNRRNIPTDTKVLASALSVSGNQVVASVAGENPMKTCPRAAIICPVKIRTCCVPLSTVSNALLVKHGIMIQ